jgi:hypothetical protein
MRRIFVLLAVTTLAAGCGDSSAPTRPTDALNFLRLAPTAPPYANAVDSFWAKKGTDREIRIYFQPVVGQSDSAELLRFKVSAQSLAQWPDGTPFATGDSVLIHITVIDPVHMIVQFEPSGLVFSSSKPAELKFEFGEADNDLNDDGVVNSTDDSLKAQLHLWRQESAGQPWVQLSSVVDVSIEEVEAEIFGFTNYALAF